MAKFVECFFDREEGTVSTNIVENISVDDYKEELRVFKLSDLAKYRDQIKESVSFFTFDKEEELEKECTAAIDEFVKECKVLGATDDSLVELYSMEYTSTLQYPTTHLEEGEYDISFNNKGEVIVTKCRDFKWSDEDDSDEDSESIVQPVATSSVDGRCCGCYCCCNSEDNDGLVDCTDDDDWEDEEDKLDEDSDEDVELEDDCYELEVLKEHDELDDDCDEDDWAD